MYVILGRNILRDKFYLENREVDGGIVLTGVEEKSL